MCDQSLWGEGFGGNSPGQRHSKYAAADGRPEANPARADLCIWGAMEGKVKKKSREGQRRGERRGGYWCLKCSP